MIIVHDQLTIPFLSNGWEGDDVQEARTTDNSRPLRPHIQGHSRSLTYPIKNLYTRLPISD